MSNINKSKITLEKAPAYRFVILATICFVYIQIFINFQLTTTYGTFIQEQLNISVTQLGFLTSAFIIGICLINIFVGELAARISAKNTVLAALVLQVVSAVVFPALSNNFTSLLVIRFIQGISGGALMGTVLGLAGVWFPLGERGLAIGVLQGFFGIALSIMTSMGLVMINMGFTWQTGGSIILGGFGVVAAILFFIFFKEVNVAYPGIGVIDEILPQPESQQSEEAADDGWVKPKNFKEALKFPKFWMMMCSTFCNNWVSFGLAYVLPLLLSIEMKLSVEQSTALLSATFFSTLIAAPLGGWLSDKVFKGKRSPVVTIGYALCLICLIFTPKAPISIIGAVLFVTFGAVPLMNGPFWCLPVEIFDSSFIIKLNGFLMFITFMGGVIGIPVLGYAVDKAGSVLAPLYILVGVCAVGTLCGIGIKK